MVRGLRIQNSPKFHMKFDGCEGVIIDRLSISSPKLSPNTDGIHIENTKLVGIYNSVIGNGSNMPFGFNNLLTSGKKKKKKECLQFAPVLTTNDFLICR